MGSLAPVCPSIVQLRLLGWVLDNRTVQRVEAVVHKMTHRMMGAYRSDLEGWAQSHSWTVRAACDWIFHRMGLGCMAPCFKRHRFG